MLAPLAASAASSTQAGLGQDFAAGSPRAPPGFPGKWPWRNHSSPRDGVLRPCASPSYHARPRRCSSMLLPVGQHAASISCLFMALLALFSTGWNRVWPNSTTWPFCTQTSAISPSVLGGDFVHQLHGLDDAQHVALFHPVAHRHEGGARPARRAAYEHAHHGGLDLVTGRGRRRARRDRGSFRRRVRPAGPRAAAGAAWRARRMASFSVQLLLGQSPGRSVRWRCITRASCAMVSTFIRFCPSSSRWGLFRLRKGDAGVVPAEAQGHRTAPCPAPAFAGLRWAHSRGRSPGPAPYS